MYPPILVLLLALVSISRQSSALELLEDDGRYDYSSPYASAGGSLLGYGGPTTGDEPATASPLLNAAAASAQPALPSVLLDTVYYQQPKDHQSDYGGSSSIEMKTSSMEESIAEEKDRAYGGRFNSSEAIDDDVYFTTSSIADIAVEASLERNDSAELQPTVPQAPQPLDHEARASVAQAFVSDHHPIEQTAREEALGAVPSSSRALDHRHHHHHEAPSEETTNLLYTRTDSSTGNGDTNNDSAEPPNSSGGGVASRFDSTETNDGENSVEESQEEDVLVTTTGIPSSLPSGTSAGSDVDSPPAVPASGVHIPTKPPAYPAIDESKISKTELLSRLIVDKNLRWPIAFLVDASNDSLVFTKKVLDASLVPKSPMDAILLRYNGTGISKSVAFRNTKSLMEAINQLQPSYDRGGSEYYGILRTSQEVPYDSAIFLATSKSTTDPQLSRMTALTLLKKRIRLYILWFGDEMDTNQRLDNQTGLHELAYKTGGRVIQFEIDRDFGSNPLLTSLVSEHDLHGAQTIPIGVDETVHSLYFKLHGHLDQATLETPHGD
uniref:Putative conserved secreted protein n=1 Tax=Anopheles marajoara TaxID=58244 RepID=A0A2M4BJ75_9DIPT